MLRLQIGVLALMFAACALVAGCDALRPGSYTVENQSRSPLLTQASLARCDQANTSNVRANSWFVVEANSTQKVNALGLTKCVLVADTNRRIILAQPYANGRVFTFHPDGSSAASDLPRDNAASWPSLRLPDLGAGNREVFLLGSAAALIVAVAFSIKFLYDYQRPPRLVPSAVNPGPVTAAGPEAGAPPYPAHAAPPAGPADEGARPVTRLRIYALAVVLAVAGGFFGIIGAIVQEVQAGPGILLAFVGGPIIEEALKPAGIYVALVRWPRHLRGGWAVAVLAAVSGLIFGLVESFVYVNVYHRSGGPDYVAFRYTVPVAMHVLASFVVGLGLSPQIVDWAAGRGPVPGRARNMYLAGVGIHAFYNITVVTLSLTHVLKFD